MELCSSNIFCKKVCFLYFGSRNPEKISYILGNGNSKTLLTFQEVTFRDQNNEKLRS